MPSRDLRKRTKEFAIEVVRFARKLPPDPASRHIGGQVLRAGTSVAANYRAACRARSRREFLAKLGIVEEEADESVFWLELLGDSQLVESERVAALLLEANELTAIVVASIRTVRSRGRP